MAERTCGMCKHCVVETQEDGTVCNWWPKKSDPIPVWLMREMCVDGRPVTEGQSADKCQAFAWKEPEPNV